MRGGGAEIDMPAHQEIAGAGLAFDSLPRRAHRDAAIMAGQVLKPRPQKSQPLHARYPAVGIQRVRHIEDAPPGEGSLKPAHEALAAALGHADAEKKAAPLHSSDSSAIR